MLSKEEIENGKSIMIAAIAIKAGFDPVKAREMLKSLYKPTKEEMEQGLALLIQLEKKYDNVLVFNQEDARVLFENVFSKIKNIPFVVAFNSNDKSAMVLSAFVAKGQHMIKEGGAVLTFGDDYVGVVGSKPIEDDIEEESIKNN